MQVQVRLAQGSRVDQLSRVIARLHAAKAEPAALRHADDLIVITLADASDGPRVKAVLARVVDVLSVADVDAQPRRTTYVPYIRPVRAAG